LLTAAATAGAVARDRAAHALELLWTRGITPRSYLLARWAGAGILLALVTVAGPFLLWICAVLFAEDWGLLVTTGGFLPGLLGGLLLVTALWSGLCVLVSALSASTGQAIVVWCLLMVGSSGVANVMAEVFREPAVRSWLSVWDAGGIVARALAGVSTRGAPWLPAALVLSGALVVLALFVRRRIAVTEAVA
jgi:ABC-type transport system involved in multi-copper enzyme maturation permease subunit